MKVSTSMVPHKVDLGSLDPGDVFTTGRSEDDVYMKSDENREYDDDALVCIHIKSGVIRSFGGGLRVTYHPRAKVTL